MFDKEYPNCVVERPSNVGDGYCDDYSNYNTEECGWDGGDCNIFNSLTDCVVEYADEIGDGYCDLGDREYDYMTPECNYDGGDCLEFKALLERCGDDFWHCISWSTYNNQECNGDWFMWTGGQEVQWCKERCVQLGNKCQAFDHHSDGCNFYETLDSTESESGTKCFKKTVN